MQILLALTLLVLEAYLGGGGGGPPPGGEGGWRWAALGTKKRGGRARFLRKGGGFG